jgi:hypothetical protein
MKEGGQRGEILRASRQAENPLAVSDICHEHGIISEIVSHLEDPVVLVLRLVNKCRITDAAFYPLGPLGPAEGLGDFIPVREPASDRAFQTADTIEATATDGLAGDQGAATFDLVEP